MAVVRAVSAFEIFMRRAFLEPYLRSRMPVGLDDIVVRALIDDPNRWRERLAPLLETCWGITPSAIDGWRELGAAWKRRNAIVHDGADCHASEARELVRACEKVVEGLLRARHATFAPPGAL